MATEHSALRGVDVFAPPTERAADNPHSPAGRTMRTLQIAHLT